MDELLRALGQLQEELKRTLSANEMIEAAKKASERITPILKRLDELLDELKEVNFPQTLKDLKEIVYATYRSIDDAKDGIKEVKRSIEQVSVKIDGIKEQLTLLGEKQTKLFENHFKLLNDSITTEALRNKKRQVITISLNIMILIVVIIILTLFLMR